MFVGSIRTLQAAPISPPIATATTSSEATRGSVLPALIHPISPAIEFTKINTADVPATCFTGADLMKRRVGVRNTPPPTPVRPERSPSKIPTANSSADCPSAVCPSKLFGAACGRGTLSRQTPAAERMRTPPPPPQRKERREPATHRSTLQGCCHRQEAQFGVPAHTQPCQIVEQ